MLVRSRALAASDRSIAASILGDWVRRVQLDETTYFQILSLCFFLKNVILQSYI
jgi:hypothetical protein